MFRVEPGLAVFASGEGEAGFHCGDLGFLMDPAGKSGAGSSRLAVDVYEAGLSWRAPGRKGEHNIARAVRPTTTR